MRDLAPTDLALVSCLPVMFLSNVQVGGSFGFLGFNMAGLSAGSSLSAPCPLVFCLQFTAIFHFIPGKYLVEISVRSFADQYVISVVRFKKLPSLLS